MLISLVRHAESSANAAGVWQGQGSTPLTDAGRRQVERLAERLGDRPFDLVVASDLERAMETAGGLARRMEVDPAWREMNLGEWEGLTREEGDVLFRRELEAAAGEPFRLGGTGETFAEFGARIEAAFQAVAARLPEDGRALVVTHGGAIGAMVRGFWPDRRRRFGPSTNTGLTTIAIEEGHRRLAAYNDAGHLAPLTGWGAAQADEGAALLTLIRHGQTRANVEQRWQGRTDWGLDETGHRQARRLADWYGQLPTLITSPLSRAVETATYLADGRPPRLHPDLAEIRMGRWENLTTTEVREAWGDLWRRIFELGEDLPRGEDGETWAQLTERVAAAASQLVGEPEAGGRMGIVFHGAALRALVGHYLGLTWLEARHLATPANTGITHVVLGEEGAMLADYNGTFHLD